MFAAAAAGLEYQSVLRQDAFEHGENWIAIAKRGGNVKPVIVHFRGYIAGLHERQEVTFAGLPRETV
jgi:hypothetical protein